MERYHAPAEEQQVQIDDYKKAYPKFIPYRLGTGDIFDIGNVYYNLISTQNGVGDDDYCLPNDSKLYKYMEMATKGSKVLFIGTGTGREVLAGLSLGLDAYGITLGSRNVYFAKNYLKIPEDRIFEATVESMPFPNNTFDFVFGHQIFEHAISPMIFLLMIGKVLKYGGKVFLEWPPARNFTFDDNPHHTQCLCLGQAKGILMKTGFNDIKMSHEDLIEITDNSVIWNCDSDKMCCILGTKKPSDVEYINKIWTLTEYGNG